MTTNYYKNVLFTVIGIEANIKDFLYPIEFAKNPKASVPAIAPRAKNIPIQPVA